MEGRNGAVYGKLGKHKLERYEHAVRLRFVVKLVQSCVQV